MLTDAQARRLSETMEREQFISSTQMRNNIYQIRIILGLPYIYFGAATTVELLGEWKHLTRLAKDWKVTIR